MLPHKIHTTMLRQMGITVHPDGSFQMPFSDARLYPSRLDTDKYEVKDLENVRTNKPVLAVGTAIGLALSALLFFTIPAYHDYLVWSWSHYWFLAPFGVAGFIIGYLRR